MNWTFFHKLASPKWFYEIAGKIYPWLMAGSLLLFAYGLVQGLYWSPPDYQQGNSVRIMYIHVPSAFMSMFAYMMMGVAAAIGYIWRIKMAHAVAASVAPVGAVFTALALFTGAVWGRPTWGTWWVWDARITSELILLFLYLGFIALRHSFDDVQTGDRAAGVLAMVGIVNVPIIHFSVEWWHTLHQGATLSKFAKPTMDSAMLLAVLLMIVAFKLFFVATVLRRVRNEVLWRERGSSWVRQLLMPAVDNNNTAKSVSVKFGERH